MRPAALALALLAPALRADGLSDLRAALQRLPATQPVKATVDCQIWNRTVKDKQPKIIQGQIQVKLEEGPAGLKLGWDKAELDHIQAATKAKDLGPQQAIGTVGAAQVETLLDAAKDLVDILEGGQIQEDRTDTWQGRPARLLIVKLGPPNDMDASDRKHIKSYSHVVKVWMAPDGTPLGLSGQEDYKASFFFIGWEQHTKESRTFARVGDRLVTAHDESESNGSGAGQQVQLKTVINAKF